MWRHLQTNNKTLLSQSLGFGGLVELDGSYESTEHALEHAEGVQKHLEKMVKKVPPPKKNKRGGKKWIREVII